MTTQIVFVNGTFDVLHCGHLSLLRAARDLGGVVHVAIDSDERVRRLKGTTRPIQPQQQRAEILRALRYVDHVTVFTSDDDLLNTVAACQPDVMVKGDDYAGKTIIGAEHCKRIVFIRRTDDSTTKTIARILDR